ncbi:cystathionine gamma-synthase [Coprinopsis cinerea AmutBmut pab1-1]|nr:cystathionine gamma-synthase [Coprinopsis cinerea AmutBmut pab1-1]
MNESSLGNSVPPDTPHAISVSLPTWRDNVGYEEGEKRVVEKMVTGYPRFFIHLSVQKLAAICEHKYAVGNERCMLFPSKKVAELCRSFIQHRSGVLGKPVSARIVDLLICPDESQPQSNGTTNGTTNTTTAEANGKPCSESIANTCAELHIVLFPGDAFSVAKEFWQHTGLGISSRFAEKCLSLLPKEDRNRTVKAVERPVSPVQRRGLPAGRGFNKHYSAVKKGAQGVSSTSPRSPTFPPISPTTTNGNGAVPANNCGCGDEDEAMDSVYLEERYGRNLPLSAASFAKRALRRRVAGVLLCDVPDCQGTAGQEDLVVGPSTRGVKDVSENDVYLYPSGMTAIWSAHQVALGALGEAKSVCFGFPYTDTLKILQKWGPGCHFLGHGLDSDIDELEKILESESQAHPGTRPILALFTEFPSNPLLRSADLPRLRRLADKYDFLIIIDETIGNLVNVTVMQYADVVVSSLTKVFSGASNVMGGSLILNPKGRQYKSLKEAITKTYEDTYFDEDAIYMERNSRDFKKRIQTINQNAEAICDFLYTRSLKGGSTNPNTAIKEVFYPKYTTPEHYDHCRVTSAQSEDGKAGGYGGLFSLTFTSLEASKLFFDTLPCFKGPSLGTNFTLACPFTILAHYGELEWAAEFGVEEGLVRVSVGLEETGKLLESFELAVKAAEGVVKA